MLHFLSFPHWRFPLATAACTGCAVGPPRRDIVPQALTPRVTLDAAYSRQSNHERPVSVPVYDGSPKYVAGIPNMFRNIVYNLLCGSPLNVTYLPARRAPPPPASTYARSRRL
jgi:hypothetical protein